MPPHEAVPAQAVPAQSTPAQSAPGQAAPAQAASPWPQHPYAKLPDRAFWRRAVAADHSSRLRDLADSRPDLATARIATAGSCFAQQISRSLRTMRLGWMDHEPAPAFLTAEAAINRGYGIYSCRYGNIYTPRQLLQLLQEAFFQRRLAEDVWTRDGRHYDVLRPTIEPHGFGSAAEVRALRASHLGRVRALFQELDVLVFTLGLTEAWVAADGTVLPVAPGVVAGDYDPARYHFHNFRHAEVLADLTAFLDGLRRVNPRAQLLLTVSPVPLVATASGQHVLVASTHSKSVLRAVAGELAADHPGVSYFPAYEIITGQPARHMHYNPDLRTVSEAGVAEVMRHFFAATQPPPPPPAHAPALGPAGFEFCDEILLDPGPA